MSVIEITSLAHDGRGVGRENGKAIFVTGAVPGDVVQYRLRQRQKRFDEAELVEVETASPDRVSPFCKVYEACGGCQLQHLSLSAQRHWKAEAFFSALNKALAKTHKHNPFERAADLVSADRGYRRRARLVQGKNKSDAEKIPKVGFRAPASNDIVDIEQCPLLSPALNQHLQTQRPTWLETASRNLHEITLVEADNGVFDSSQPSEQTPYYELDGLRFQFDAEGFIQVNADVNQQMVAQALDWLEVRPDDKVLDLFCGVGNFTLPLAKRCQQVVGVEGDNDLIATARDNAAQNGLENVSFHKANLFEDAKDFPWFAKQRYDRVLLDPGRPGAMQICQQLGALGAKQLVYVSCNAATLIRDVKVLSEQGYVVTKAGFMDMFPHTSHAEVMVQLVRKRKAAPKKKRPVFRM